MDYENIDIAICIHRIMPDASYTMDGDLYSDIIWEDSRPIPTESNLRDINIIIKNEMPSKILRFLRNLVLKNCDMYGLTDYPHSSNEIKTAWLTYRQKLRDLPSIQTPLLNENDELINIIWPTDPNGNSLPP
jgi:hypothetical protein